MEHDFQTYSRSPTGLTLWEEERAISRSKKFMGQDGDLTHSVGPSLLTQMSSGGCKRKMGFTACMSLWPGPSHHHLHLGSLTSADAFMLLAIQ